MDRKAQERAPVYEALEKFGKMAVTGYNVDSFGHNGNLPQILKKSGMDNYVFMRPMPNEKGLPGRIFRWKRTKTCRTSRRFLWSGSSPW